MIGFRIQEGQPENSIVFKALRNNFSGNRLVLAICIVMALDTLMQAVKEPVQVSILNQTFPVHTDAPDDHVERVAKLVTKKVKEIQSRSKKASSLHVALLACLNIADELLRYKENSKSNQTLAAKKLSDVIEIIDLHL